MDSLFKYDYYKSGFSQMECEFNSMDAFNKNICQQSNLIACINIRSLNKHFEELEAFIDSLVIKPCVIVCTETWNVQSTSLFKLQGYNIYYNEGEINKADGVAMYLREDIIADTTTVIIDNIKILRSEMQLKGGDTLTISSFYRSHDLSKFNFVSSIKKYLTDNRNTVNHCLIGDFNMDILDLNVERSNNYDRYYNQEFLNTLLTFEYKPFFTGITRPANDNEKGTCIDNFYIKSDNLNFLSSKITVPFNDHYPIFVTFNKSILHESESSKKDYLNYKKIKTSAKNINWNSLLELQDPNVAVDALITTINKCISNSKVLKTNDSNRFNNKPRSKWITTAILVSCKTKELLYNIWMRDKNNVQAKQEYNSYCKVLNKVIVDAKMKYEKSMIEKNKNDSKYIWNVIDNKLGRSKRSNNIIKQMNVDGNIINSTDEIVNEMNKYFCDIGTTLSDSIVHPPNTELKLPDRNLNSVFFSRTNAREITFIIKKMKNKSGGIDKISVMTLKCLMKFIVNPMEHIFNLCFDKCVWPDKLKCAEVIPVFKGGDKTSMSNYRPISLISNIAKVMEKIVHKRLYSFLIKNKIISEKQFGFLKNKGTTDALNNICNIIYNKLDTSKPIIAVFLDLAKAFDTVQHSILLLKLERYGIRGNTLKLINSYLSNRKQCVKMKDSCSAFEEINIGVPQGTILGPLFFLVYINDLLIDYDLGEIIAYADDTVLIVSEETWELTKVKIKMAIKQVAIWLALNKLSLNLNKTTYITFGNYKDSVPYDIELKLGDTIIKRQQTVKYLGVIFDFNMRWNEHILSTIKRTRYLIYVLAKLRKTMNYNALLIIYYALFQSIAGYGIIAWGGAYSNLLDLIQGVQDKILKLIRKNKFINENPPLNFLKQFQYQSLCFHYKELSRMFVESKSITRYKSLQIPKNNKTVCSKNSYLVAIKVFNRLPNELKNLTNSHKVIKSKLKTFFYT